jgi:hypothetical protein
MKVCPESGAVCDLAECKPTTACWVRDTLTPLSKAALTPAPTPCPYCGAESNIRCCEFGRDR